MDSEVISAAKTLCGRAFEYTHLPSNINGTCTRTLPHQCPVNFLVLATPLCKCHTLPYFPKILHKWPRLHEILNAWIDTCMHICHPPSLVMSKVPQSCRNSTVQAAIRYMYIHTYVFGGKRQVSWFLSCW